MTSKLLSKLLKKKEKNPTPTEAEQPPLSDFELLQLHLLENDTEVFSYEELMAVFGEQEKEHFYKQYCQFPLWRSFVLGQHCRLYTWGKNHFFSYNHDILRSRDVREVRSLDTIDGLHFEVSTMEFGEQIYSFHLDKDISFEFVLLYHVLPFKDKSTALFFNPRGFCFYLRADFSNARTVLEKLVIRMRQKEENIQQAADAQRENDRKKKEQLVDEKGFYHY